MMLSLPNTVVDGMAVWGEVGGLELGERFGGEVGGEVEEKTPSPPLDATEKKERIPLPSPSFFPFVPPIDFPFPHNKNER